jgi:hypothetical protein
MANGIQVFGKPYVSTASALSVRWALTTSIPNLQFRLQFAAEKDKVPSESPLAGRLASSLEKFKEEIGNARGSDGPAYRSAVGLLWEIALADEKQPKECLEAAKEALKHVVLHESEPSKISFYGELFDSPPPSDILRAAEQKMEFFIFLARAESHKEPRDSVAAMAAVDCINHLLGPVAIN